MKYKIVKTEHNNYLMIQVLSSYIIFSFYGGPSSF